MTQKEKNEELQQLLEAASKGDAQAQYELGNLYNEYEDYEEALKWWGLAAAQGHPHALYFIGLCYKEGRGVKQSDFEAVQKWLLAGLYDDADALYNLGWMYYYGKGTECNMLRARVWFFFAAMLGHIEAKETFAKLMAMQQ